MKVIAGVSILSLSIVVVSFTVFVGTLSAHGPKCKNTDTDLMCVEFLYNYDGDTIAVSIPEVHPLLGKSINVRVRGANTPEKVSSNECERTAAIIVRDKVNKILKSATHIDLLNVSRDKYFRILADVSADGKLVKDFLLENKYAVPYDGGTKAKVDWCYIK